MAWLFEQRLPNLSYYGFDAYRQIVNSSFYEFAILQSDMYRSFYKCYTGDVYLEEVIGGSKMINTFVGYVNERNREWILFDIEEYKDAIVVKALQPRNSLSLYIFFDIATLYVYVIVVGLWVVRSIQ